MSTKGEYMNTRKFWQERAKDAEDKCQRLAAENAGLHEALGASIQAIDDWLHQYAPDFCGKNYVVETHKRIIESGGTLAYITDVQAKNRLALTGDGSAVLAVVEALKELLSACDAVCEEQQVIDPYSMNTARQALANLDSEDDGGGDA